MFLNHSVHTSLEQTFLWNILVSLFYYLTYEMQLIPIFNLKKEMLFLQTFSSPVRKGLRIGVLQLLYGAA